MYACLLCEFNLRRYEHKIDIQYESGIKVLFKIIIKNINVIKVIIKINC